MHISACLCSFLRCGKDDSRLEICTTAAALCRFLAVFCKISGKFGVVFRFCKHAKFSKVNAKFFCGVDFFQPSKEFLSCFEANELKISVLTNPLKTRVFSAKSFFVQNFENMRAFNGFWEVLVLTNF